MQQDFHKVLIQVDKVQYTVWKKCKVKKQAERIVWHTVSASLIFRLRDTLKM